MSRALPKSFATFVAVAFFTLGAIGTTFAPASVAQQWPAAGSDHTLEAMRAELQRSKADLQLPGQQKPFFIEYRLVDLDVRTITASFGALVSSTTTHNRFMDVGIRVGDYKIDNSNFISGDEFQGFLGSSGEVGVDGDYESLRQDLWLATDQAYKQALTGLAQKMGFLGTLSKLPEVADFSAAKPVQQIDPRAIPDWTNRNWEQEARQATAGLRNYPDLYGNRITYTLVYETYYLINSEGTEIRTPHTLAAIEAAMETQASDGVPMHHFFTAYSSKPADLPTADVVAHEIDARTKRLMAMRSAEPMPAYGGPVLFDARASAELIAQMMPPSISGSRPPLSMLPMYDQIIDSRGGRSEWTSRLNSRVLPTGTSLVDDPSAKDAQGRALPGSYIIDDEGVAPVRVSVVENGMLRNFLMSRRPGPDSDQSNGHARTIFLGTPQASSSNLTLSSTNGISATDLKKKFLDECQKDGRQWCLLVRELDNPVIGDIHDNEISDLVAGAANGDRVPLEVFKVNVADGSEELLRPGHLLNMNLRLLRDATGFGNDQLMYAYEQSATPLVAGTNLAAFGSTADGMPSTVTAPSILFDDVEGREARGEMKRLPLVPPPPMQPDHQ
jgi:TldD protein